MSVQRMGGHAHVKDGLQYGGRQRSSAELGTTPACCTDQHCATTGCLQTHEVANALRVVTARPTVLEVTGVFQRGEGSVGAVV